MEYREFPQFFSLNFAVIGDRRFAFYLGPLSIHTLFYRQQNTVVILEMVDEGNLSS
jgi:hypothetical protein